MLVYSPARLTHINVMVELAKYLRNCNVAVIDMIDVTDATGKVSKRLSAAIHFVEMLI